MYAFIRAALTSDERVSIIAERIKEYEDTLALRRTDIEHAQKLFEYFIAQSTRYTTEYMNNLTKDQLLPWNASTLEKNFDTNATVAALKQANRTTDAELVTQTHSTIVSTITTRLDSIYHLNQLYYTLPKKNVALRN